MCLAVTFAFFGCFFCFVAEAAGFAGVDGFVVPCLFFYHGFVFGGGDYYRFREVALRGLLFPFIIAPSVGFLEAF